MSGLAAQRIPLPLLLLLLLRPRRHLLHRASLTTLLLVVFGVAAFVPDFETLLAHFHALAALVRSIGVPGADWSTIRLRFVDSPALQRSKAQVRFRPGGAPVLSS
jgi:hypothetical protein